MKQSSSTKLYDKKVNNRYLNTASKLYSYVVVPQVTQNEELLAPELNTFLITNSCHKNQKQSSQLTPF